MPTRSSRFRSSSITMGPVAGWPGACCCCWPGTGMGPRKPVGAKRDPGVGVDGDGAATGAVAGDGAASVMAASRSVSRVGRSAGMGRGGGGWMRCGRCMDLEAAARVDGGRGGWALAPRVTPPTRDHHRATRGQTHPRNQIPLPTFAGPPRRVAPPPRGIACITPAVPQLPSCVLWGCLWMLGGGVQRCTAGRARAAPAACSVLSAIRPGAPRQGRPTCGVGARARADRRPLTCALRRDSITAGPRPGPSAPPPPGRYRTTSP